MDVVNIDTQMGFAFFTIITTVYFILNYFVGRPSRVKNGGLASFSLSFCYFLLIATSQFLLNLQLTAGMCKGVYQYTTAVYVTLIPWVLIFGILSLLLTVFPGWLSPFSNTLGYLMTTMLDIKKLIRDVFKEPGTDDNSKAKETLQYIYGNQSLLINEITISNFEIFKDTMKELIRPDAMLNSNPEDKITKIDKLKDMVYLKELVAQYVWYILSGSLVIAIATNSIITSGCNYTETEYSELSRTT